MFGSGDAGVVPHSQYFDPNAGSDITTWQEVLLFTQLPAAVEHDTS